jgi:hypothetical protein
MSEKNLQGLFFDSKFGQDFRNGLVRLLEMWKSVKTSSVDIHRKHELKARNTFSRPKPEIEAKTLSREKFLFVENA